MPRNVQPPATPCHQFPPVRCTAAGRQLRFEAVAQAPKRRADALYVVRHMRACVCLVRARLDVCLRMCARVMLHWYHRASPLAAGARQPDQLQGRRRVRLRAHDRARASCNMRRDARATQHGTIQHDTWRYAMQRGARPSARARLAAAVVRMAGGDDRTALRAKASCLCSASRTTWYARRCTPPPRRAAHIVTHTRTRSDVCARVRRHACPGTHVCVRTHAPAQPCAGPATSAPDAASRMVGATWCKHGATLNFQPPSQIGDIGADALLAAIPNSNLTTLICDHNEISDEKVA
jgi:hypothetical protein